MKMAQKMIVILLMFTTSSVLGTSHQRDSTLYFLALKAQSGFIFEHTSELNRLSERPVIGAQLDFSILKNSRKSWDYCNCYCKNGVSLRYTDFGNTRELGSAVSAVFFVEPYLSFSKRTQFSFQAGFGPAYLNRVHDEVTNPDNLFYSMPLSYFLTLNTNLYWSVSPRTQLSITAQFNHISNGGTRIPNFGINFPVAGIGIQHVVGDFNLKPRSVTTFNNHSLKFIGHVFGGPRVAKAFPSVTQVRKLFWGINVGVLKPLGRISSIGVGVEWYYDPISKIYKERKQEDYRTHIGSVSFQHYLFFGKLIFGQQMAYYVTPRNPDINTNFYQRYFVGYQLNKFLTAGVSMKVHGGTADHAALTTGFIF